MVAQSENVKFKEWLKAKSINFKSMVDLGKRSQIKAGGIAAIVVYPSTQRELANVIVHLRSLNSEYQVIGNLSNVLFRDGLIETPFIHLNAMKDISSDEQGVFTVGAGALMPSFARHFAKQGFEGLSGLVGIPGTVGGGIYMNASCYGSCISDYLLDVTCVDLLGRSTVLLKSDLGLNWRTSAFHDQYRDYVIVCARFSFPKGNADRELSLINDISSHRKTYQEKILPNLGSLFATKDIYSDLSNHFFGYKICLMLLRIACRLAKENRDRYFAKFARKMTLLYFGIGEYQSVGFSQSTFNCVVNLGGATADQIIDKIEQVQQAINNKVPIENELIKEIL